MILIILYTGETIPIRLFLGGFELTPTFRGKKNIYINYLLNKLIIINENRCQQEILYKILLESSLD